MNDDDSTSVDLNAVRRDDDFVNALAAGGYLPPADAEEAKLGDLLYAWRAEALAAPAEPLALSDVEHAIAMQAARAEQAKAVPDDAARTRRTTRMRHLRVLSGAAAITAVAAAGLLVMSEHSQPGDPLWNVKKVVFSQAAAQTEAAVDAQSSLERAEAALASGDIGEANALVAAAEKRAQASDPETRERMEQWIRRLRDESKPPVTTTTTTTPSEDAGPIDETVPPTDDEVPNEPTTTEPSESTEPTRPTTPSSSATSPKPTGSASSTVTTTTTASSKPASATVPVGDN